MNEEERSVLSLPPFLQRRMAKLVLMGWHIRRATTPHTSEWRATPPKDFPTGRAVRSAYTFY